MSKKTLKQLDVSGKKVQIRVDFNVPLHKETGEITDDTRIRKAIPSIRYVLNNGGSLILMSHLGRPKGEPDPSLSMKKVGERLSGILDKPVTVTSDCIGEEVQKAVDDMESGDITLLENVRFHAGEKSDDDEEKEAFSKQLFAFGDVYVNDAFGTCHRAHASMVGHRGRMESAIGFLVEKEIEVLNDILKDPARPMAAILGGAKVSGKIGVIESFLDLADRIIIGGGMMFTFRKVLGRKIGNSLCEEDKLENAKKILNKAENKGVAFLTGTDILAADKVEAGAETRVVASDVPDDWIGVDIGPETTESYIKALSDCKLIFWNGPMGVFEIDAFSKGTRKIAEALAEIDAVTVIGGGDSAAAVKKFNVADKMYHISTGGGATLKYIEGGDMPGLEAVEDID